jgi:hypothetical protein
MRFDDLLADEQTKSKSAAWRARWWSPKRLEHSALQMLRNRIPVIRDRQDYVCSVVGDAHDNRGIFRSAHDGISDTARNW